MSAFGFVSSIKNLLGHRSVLLIDDDMNWHRVLKLMIERRLGYDFYGEIDGMTGLEAAKALKPSIILLDWVMPGMSGMAVLDHLHEDPETKNIPVLMLTGRDKMGDIDRAIRHGAFDFICKTEALVKLPDKIPAFIQECS